MKITVDYDRAWRVFDTLVRALRAKRYPYNISVLPQDLLPEEMRMDKMLHARFLFYVCHFMRGAIDSVHVIRQLSALWYESPWMFEPGLVVARDVADVKAQLARAVDYHLDEIASFWWENSRRLYGQWRGDPRLLFEGVRTAEEAMRRIINKDGKRQYQATDLFEHEWGFLGFQGKMTSMLAYFLMEAKLIRPIQDIPPAVDFHLLRVMFASRILTAEGLVDRTDIRYDVAYPQGVKVVKEYLRKRNVSPVVLGDALWCLSQTACSQAPGNRSVGRTRSGEEKARRLDGKKAAPSFLTLDPHNDVHLSLYAQTCARCPAGETCEINVQSGSYYETGRFRFRKRQHLPARMQLFGMLPDHPHPQRRIGGTLATPPCETQVSFLGNNEPDA